MQCMAAILYKESQMQDGLGMGTTARKGRPKLRATPTGNA